MGDAPWLRTRTGGAPAARRTQHPARYVRVRHYRVRRVGGGGLQGDGLVAEAALCWGSYTAISIFLLRECSPLTVAGYTMLFADA